MISLRGDKIELLYDKRINKEYAVGYQNLKAKEIKASIMSDVMFKTMFQNNNRLKYSARLLSYYLDISEEYLLKNIRLVKNELDKKNKDEKGERCDYVAEVNGTTINIEVNNNSKVEIMERNMEYAHRLYAEKVKSGGNSKYTQVIQINLNNFSFEGNDKIVDKYYIQNDEGIKLNNKLIFVQIYVPNLRKKCYNEGKDNLREEEKYALMLVEPDVELSKSLGKGDILMEEYIEEAIEVSMGNHFGESYDKEWAREDEGRTDGEKKAKKEMATAMLSKGINIKLVSECTGMDIEELQKMKEDIVVNFGESYDRKWAREDEWRTNESKKIATAMLKDNVNIDKIATYTGLTIEEIQKL